MTSAAVIFAYLAASLYIGIFAFRRTRDAQDAEGYFLAGRSLGPAVFLRSIFSANMTAFSILGASGHAFANGIVTFGLMASSSALVIPITIFVIGTRLWAIGRATGSSLRCSCSAIAGNAGTSAPSSSWFRPCCWCLTSSSR